MRLFPTFLILLFVTTAMAMRCHAAELDCGMFLWSKNPNSHEQRYLTPKSPSPIFPSVSQPPPPPGLKPLNCVWARLHGPIVEGDYDKVVQAIRVSWPDLSMFDLISPGGSVSEALKIGRLLRKYLVTANVPKLQDPAPSDFSAICASACALIWFGGVERMGSVGLHRPRITDPEFASLPPDQGVKIYRTALTEIESYLTEMEVPRPIVDDMLATSSADIRWVNAIADGLSRPPSYAEWEDATCHDRFNPENGPFVDACRGPLRADRVKQLSPP